jgi:predicted ArsR family transcriptional regulator
MSQLHLLGATQQALLRHLLRSPDDADVESLCARLRVSHNAVRQHLTALISRGWVERAPSVPSGGRPQARFRLTAAGRALFPRNYSLIANALLEAVTERVGDSDMQAMLADLGARLGATEPIADTATDIELASALAERLDRAGYEAVATTRGGQAQVEAFNCVFHSLARKNSHVCRFDIAFMEAASGRRVQHTECIVRGGHVCRFLIGSDANNAQT